MLPLWATVDLGAIAIKGSSTFSKAPALLKPHYHIVKFHIQNTRWGESYPSTEILSVYSTPPVEWDNINRILRGTTTRVREDQFIGIPHFSNLQNWSLTSRYSLVSYPRHFYLCGVPPCRGYMQHILNLVDIALIHLWQKIISYQL